MIPSVLNSKRIRILNQSEINELYEIPKFSDDERRWYFELHNSEHELLKLPVTRKTKVDAILQLGYFKAKNQFFKYQHNEVKSDVGYIVNRYFDENQLTRPILSRETKRQNQIRIIDLLGFAYFNKSEHGGPLLSKARELCRLSVNPVFIFRELIEFVYKEKMTTPKYTTLQEIISNALSSEQQRIKRILGKKLPPKVAQEVLQLIQKRDSFYAVTSLKKLPRNFKPRAVYQEITHYQNNSTIFKTAKRVLPCLGISNNSIDYYASLVDHYTVRSLSRLNNDQACLWLLCFIFNRTKRILDNLAMMFCYFANQFQVAVEEKSKELIIANAIEKDAQDDCVVRLLRIFIDTGIDDSVPFKIIKEKEVYAIANPDTINQISTDLENKGRDHQAQFS